jgi:hypothetical protein
VQYTKLPGARQQTVAATNLPSPCSSKGESEAGRKFRTVGSGKVARVQSAQTQRIVIRIVTFVPITVTSKILGPRRWVFPRLDKVGLGDDAGRDRLNSLITRYFSACAWFFRPAATAKLQPASLSAAIIAHRLNTVASHRRTRPRPRSSVIVSKRSYRELIRTGAVCPGPCTELHRRH